MKEVKSRAIQINNDPIITDDCISSTVTLRENALSECILVANNEEGAMYLSTLNLYDVVTVKYAYEDDGIDLDEDNNWNFIEPIFKGWIIDLTPSLTRSGEVVSVTAMNGLGLKMMRVAHEYGLQVITDTYDTGENDIFAVVSFDNAMICNWTVEGDNPYLNDGEDNSVKIELLTVHDGDEIGHFKFNSVIFDAYDNWIVTGLKIHLKCRVTGTKSARIKPKVRYALNNYWDTDYKIVDYVPYYTEVFDFTDRLIEISDYKEFLSQLAITVQFGIGIEESEKHLQVCEAYLEITGKAWSSGGLFNLRQILTDSDNGIVPKYIEKILNTSNNSGYLLNTDYVYNDALNYTYLNFPYQDVFMCIQDLIRLGSSMHYLDNPSDWGNASNVHVGLHWIIQYDKELDKYLLLIAPVGNHDVEGIDGDYIIEDKWETKPLGDTPLIVRQDMVTQSFKTELPIANYILVAGKFIRPINEQWTESVEGWEVKHHLMGNATVSLSNIREVGSASIQMNASNYTPPSWGMFYHKIADNPTDFTTMITRDSSIKIHFRFAPGDQTQNYRMLIMSDLDNYIKYELSGMETDKFSEFSVEIDKVLLDLFSRGGELPDKWSKVGTIDFTNINYIGFYFEGGSGIRYCRVDDLFIEGNVIRGIYDNDSMEQYGCRFLTIKDSVASTDTLSSEDYTSPLAQLAIYELLRNRVVRTSGQIQIPLNPIFKGGQIVHIHGCWNGSAYAIDKYFRISEVTHQFTVQGALTLLTLTDDLYNSIPINNLDPYSMVMRMINPDFQSRTFGSLKVSGGDFSATLKPITSPLPT